MMRFPWSKKVKPGKLWLGKKRKWEEKFDNSGRKRWARCLSVKQCEGVWWVRKKANKAGGQESNKAGSWTKRGVWRSRNNRRSQLVEKEKEERLKKRNRRKSKNNRIENWENLRSIWGLELVKGENKRYKKFMDVKHHSEWRDRGYRFYVLYLM